MCLDISVKAVICSMKGTFTIRNVLEQLEEQEILNAENREKVHSIVNRFSETSLVSHIQNTNKYFVNW